MNNLEHISSPVSESWVYWILLLFFVLVAFNNSVRESVVIAMRNSFSHSERVYGGQSQNIMEMSTAWIFRVGVLALAIYLLLHISESFTFIAYTKTLGIVALIDFVRNMPNKPKAKVQSRIILNTEQAKRLLLTLQENIAKYEEKYGEIRLAGSKVNMPIGFGGFKGEA